jgi:hypothetical protein
MRIDGIAACIGAAAAVGAGVVVGLATAAPAAADDAADDAGHRAATAHTSPARHSSVLNGRRATPQPAAVTALPPGHAVSPARAGAASRGVPSPPEAAVQIPRIPTTTVAQGNSVASPRFAEPVTALVVSPSIPREVRQTAPANLPAAATTTALTVAPARPAAAAGAAPTPARVASQGNPHNFYLDPRGQKITFLKGTHFAIPGSLGLFIKKVYGTGTFTPDSAYDLKDVDQYDWNKFSGIAFTPLQPDKNSAMVGWRYNLNTREYEIAPFYNVNRQRILPNETTEVISVPADATFHYNVDYSGITLTYGDKTVFKAYPLGLTPNVWTASRVSGWFGGNEAAPRTLSYYLSFNWW